MTVEERPRVLDVPFDPVDMARAVSRVAAALATGQRLTVMAVNPEKVMRAARDPQLFGALERAGLLIPDGIGVVLAARLLGVALPQRVAGADLMPALCGMAAAEGYPVYLFGAGEAVVARTIEALRARYPGLRIAGSCHGFVSEDGYGQLVEAINRSGARLLFVGLGSPRQELWIDRYRDRLTVDVVQAVGGTFDVIAGAATRAPAIWIRLNLEWLYRLLEDPRRAARQAALPMFAARVLWRWLRLRLRRP